MMRALVGTALALWLGAEIVIGAVGGTASWPLLLGWAVVAMVAFLMGWLLSGKAERVLGAAVLVGLCVPAVFLGGLIFFPAALTLLVAACLAPGRPARTAEAGPAAV